MRKVFKKSICLILSVLMICSVFVFTATTVFAAGKTSVYSNYIKNRGNDLSNTYAKLKNGEEVNVVYYGGSVTNGDGATDKENTSWRALVGKWLVNNFPQAKVNNINAAYGGTSTMFGAYRLKHDVISQQPDLIFIEFAINDFYDNQVRALSKEEAAMRYETIVRQIRTEIPDCDIVTVLTTEKGLVSINKQGKLHDQAQGHEDISIAYNIPSIHIGRALSDKIPYDNFETVWKEYVKDIVHPTDVGHNLYFEVIKEYLANCLLYGGYNGKVVNHTLPSQVYDYLLDGDIQYIDADTALLSKSNQLGGKSFEYNESVSNLRSFPGGVKATAGSNSVFALKFTGTELTVILNSSGVKNISLTVDGKQLSAECYGIKPEILVSGLTYGEHTVTIQPVYGSSAHFYIIGFFTRNENKRTAKYDHSEHIFKTYVSDKNATCKKDGTKTAKCTVSGCDKTNTVTDVGSKLAHNYKINVIKAATTTADGEGERVCSVCGRFDGKVVIPKGKTVEEVTASENKKSESQTVKTESNIESDNSSEESSVSSTDNKTNKTQKKGTSLTLIIVLIVVLTLLFAGIGVLVFILIKRKKNEIQE